MESKPAALFVIVGHWNPSIFTVEWAREYLFPQEENLKVQLSIEKHYAVKIETKEIQLHINELYFKVSVIGEQKDTLLTDCQDIILKMCNYLSHTPIRGIGINFNINKEIQGLEDVKKIFNFSDNDAIIKNGYENCSVNKIQRTYKSGTKDLNFVIEMDDKHFNFSFNHHFNVSKMNDIKTVLDENDVLALKADTNNFLSSIYNISL